MRGPQCPIGFIGQLVRVCLDADGSICPGKAFLIHPSTLAIKIRLAVEVKCRKRTNVSQTCEFDVQLSIAVLETSLGSQRKQATNSLRTAICHGSVACLI